MKTKVGLPINFTVDIVLSITFASIPSKLPFCLHTDTDHTAYTVQTAGSEGFLNLLPIYVDHLLYPTLTVSFIPNQVGFFVLE